MKKTKTLHNISNLVAAGFMVFFAVPKLIGAEKSLEGFEQFKTLVPLGADTFRIFTGLVEILIATLLIIYTIKNTNNLGRLAYFLLLSTMIGGLIMEFFARPEPKIMLVVIAIVLAALSIYKLKLLLTHN